MLGSSALPGTSNEGDGTASGGGRDGGGGGHEGGGEVAGNTTKSTAAAAPPPSSIMEGIGEDEKAMIRAGGGDEGLTGGERGGSGGGNRWPRQETIALLKIRSDMDDKFRDSSLKGHLWDEVSRNLAELGYHRSSKKCKEKFENVYKYHKRTKDGRVGKADGKTYRFFEQLEALDNHPSNLPPPQSRSMPPAEAAVPVTMVMPDGSAPLHHHHHHHNNNHHNNVAAGNPVSIPQVTSSTATITNTNISITVPSSTAAIPAPITISQSPTGTTISATPISMNIPSNSQNLQPPPQPSSTNFLSYNHHHQHHHHHRPPQGAVNFPMPSSPSCTPSSSSSTSSDEEILGRRKRKRKWKDFFGRLMKEVIDKQKDLQRKFLDAIEKREHDRMVREEAWKMQETTRLHREHEILVQERSMAAAKDAALISFLQKLSEQQQIPLSLPMVQHQGLAPAATAAAINTSIPPHTPTPTTTKATAKTTGVLAGQQVQAKEIIFSPPVVPMPTTPAAVTVTPQPPSVITTTISAETAVAAAPTSSIVLDLQPNPKAPSMTVVTATPPPVSKSIVSSNGGENSDNYVGTSSSRWPKAEVQALIQLRTNLDQKYQESGPKGPLWEEISSSMRKLGYTRNAKRCKEKWENINKYFKKVKESNKKRPEDSKTCPYFHQLDALYREKNTSGSSSSSKMAVDQNQNSFINSSDNPAASAAGGGAVSFNMPAADTTPIMAQPEQQWPLQPQVQQPQPPEVHMEDPASDKNEEDDEGDDDDDQGEGYEIVANTGSTTAINITAAMDNS